MAYLIYHSKRTPRLELIMKDGAPFPPGEQRGDWYVQRSCLNVALALAAEVEHFGFARREISQAASGASPAQKPAASGREMADFRSRPAPKGLGFHKGY